jgi:HD-GYP domain-containing protein (c-di-GMP phosphodiesterase class II)
LKNYDFLLIAKEQSWRDRCGDISAEFDFTFKSVDSVEAYCDQESEIKEPLFVLISAHKVDAESEISGMVQVVRQMAPSSFILVVISSKLNPNVATFVKKSGANAVLMENEFFMTSKLEFISTQKIKSSYLPVKAQELTEGTGIPFPLFHLLPLNRKFLPVIRSGDVLSADRLQKLKQVSEIYIRRADVEDYQKYISSQNDKSAEGLAKRCRAQFLNLFSSYVDLVLLISDQSESSSFKLGSEFYLKCSKLSSELMTTLGATGNAWSVINNSSIGDFGSLQRAPAVAAYSGLLSLHSGMGQPVEVMTACLLSDVGLLELNPAITKKLRKKEPLDSLHPADQNDFRDHPNKSLNLVLSRKLSLPENVKNMILMSHERLDRKGFPNQVIPEKITLETMILQMSEILDNRSQIRMGQERPDISLVKKQLFEELLSESPHFSRLFLEKIRKCLVEI